MTVEVTGKVYPLWSQFVERQKEFVGGVLEEFPDSSDRILGASSPVETIITGIELRPNGKVGAFFEILGKDFSCGFDVKYGGISGSQDHGEVMGDGWLCFSGYGGRSFRIKKPVESTC